jgi:hypothetical protein
MTWYWNADSSNRIVLLTQSYNLAYTDDLWEQLPSGNRVSNLRHTSNTLRFKSYNETYLASPEIAKRIMEILEQND